MRVAVIDTGTNSTRLLVGDLSAGSINEVFRRAEITRLGEGVDRAGRLAEDAKERVSRCLGSFAATVGELGAERAVIIATSSIRDARDGVEFLKSQAGSLGFDSRLLSGEEEAGLSFAGATMHAPPNLRTLLFDVGGGSTEIVTGQGRVEFAVSIDMGCVRIKERFIRHDPVTDDELKEASLFIDSELRRTGVRDHLNKIDQAIGVAGTVTTLAALDAGLTKYEREAIHGYELTKAKVDNLMRLLSGMDIRERMMMPVMEQGRADVIVSGALIVSRLLGYTGIGAFTVSEYDILDGAALAMSQGRL